MRGAQPVDVGSRALDLLIVLTERAGEVIAHRELLASVWPTLVVEEANLRVHISSLRKALGDGKDGARYIANVPGRGYSFIAAIEPSADPVAPAALETVVPISSKSRLPPRLTRMVGRDDTVATLVRLVSERRFVSIVAAGGMGKTSVAVAVAHALVDRFDGAVYFVDLATLIDPALVVAAITAAVGIVVSGDDALAELLAFVRDKRLLLLLDNCEHVIDAVALLAERLHADGPRLYLLTTSRETLRVEGEHVYLLRPLDSPDETTHLTAGEALESAAVRLFMDRAAASGHAAPLSDDDALIVADICRRLDGIALAIELVASRVGAHGIAGTARLLDGPFRLLWQGRRSALPRHKTLQAMLDWSFDLLSERDRRVLTRLSIFVGQITLEGARFVVACGEAGEVDVAEAVQGLVERSLVWSASYSGHAFYRLPHTSRAYILLKLVERGEAAAIARRHALYMAESVGPGFFDSDERQRTLVADMTGQLGNLRAALEWSFSNEGDATIATKLAAGAAPLMLSMALLPESRRWSARALEALPEADRGTAQELALQLTLAISTLFAQGNGQVVRTAIERGLELAEALGRRRERLHLMAGLHIYLTRIGAFTEVLAISERSLLVANDYGAADAQVVADWMAGCAHHLTGNQELAQHHCEAGFERAARLGDPRLDFFGYDQRVRAMIVLARTLWLRGDADGAKVVGRGAITAAESRDDPVSLCIALIYTSTVFLWNREYLDAQALVDRLVKHADRYALGPYRAVGVALQGELNAASGDLQGGIDVMQRALVAFQSEQHLVLAAGTVRALAEALAGVGRVEEAVRLLDDALSRAGEDESQRTVDFADLLRARAQAELAQRVPDFALTESTFLASLSISKVQSALAWEIRTAVALAVFWRGRGRQDEARELLTATTARFEGTHRTADLVAARDMLDELDWSAN